MGHSFGLDLVPGWEFPQAIGCDHEEKKKKKEERKGEKERKNEV